MKKYNKKEYKKYVKEIEEMKNDGSPISFEKWRILQPIADSVINKANKIINKK